MKTNLLEKTNKTKNSVRSWLINVVVTLFVCIVIAGFTNLMNDSGYWINLRVALFFGVPTIILSIYEARFWPQRSDLWRNVLVFVLGFSIGLLHLFYTMFSNTSLNHILKSWDWLLINVLISVIVFGVIFYLFFVTYRIQRLRYDMTLQSLMAAEKDKELVLSQLKLLQSQMEPHFLFNTLANIQGLIDEDGDTAKHLVKELTTMLRASLMRTRDQATNVEDEFKILSSYLAIQAVRMGGRLDYRVTLSDDIRFMALPPFLLQPIVENAIIHGLEPKKEGGSIHVNAELVDGQLCFTVTDNGLGFHSNASSKGTGLGIKNIRERIRLLFGSEGQLQIKQLTPEGTCVIMTLPITEETTTDYRQRT